MRQRKFWRRSLAALGASGVLLQTTCNFDPDAVGGLFLEVLGQQGINIIADAIFFFLDNALVRLTA